MKILVCGGRDYTGIRKLFTVLNECITNYPPPNTLEIVQGGAKGADFLAKCWASALGINHTEFPADWKRYGKAAGAVRNQAMLDYGPDLVIAFPGGTGTADMVRRAEAAGIKVQKVVDNP
jgi:hypothetical protein